ncbi:uncharacterized protein BJX67DRAFT_386151 [Aspergillus lucknowensis]|uniref:Uncharacterized protein n=1 Tax=Aspergillus lucknowensis TaxID=176173 RepID=A0ABR4L8Y6_9EURO
MYLARTVVEGEGESADSGSFTLTRDHEIEPNQGQNEQPSIEASSSTGGFLWEVNIGSNSVNRDNISPGWTAEAFLKIANSVTFGAGAKFGQGDNEND